MEDLKYRVALSRVSALGSRRINKLVEFFGSAREAFKATEKNLARVGLPARALSVVLEERAKICPEEEWQLVRERNQKVVCPADPAYPVLLRQIYDPPPVLFYRGDLSCLGSPSVAIVGSRNASEYGKSTAYIMAKELAMSEVVVVSGMARGIDTSAHRGSLAAGGVTAAVFGCGIDICYPPENKKMLEEIAQTGVILSEFPPGTRPRPYHFPMRNRIISGLTLGTVVVEAPEKSGALITADCALEQGREVFAVPGSVKTSTHRGCHKLIKEGAALVEGAADVLGAFGLELQQSGQQGKPNLTAAQEKVLSILHEEPVHFDNILDKCCLEPAALSPILLELELSGLVKKTAGNFFLRI